MKLEVTIPSNVTVNLDGNKIKVTGSKGTVEKEFKSKVLMLTKEDNKIIVETKNDRKRVLAILNTVKSVIENLFSGVEKKYVYTLRGVYSHFPLTLAMKGKTFVINNYLGEKNPRTVNVPENVDVTIKGKEVIVSSIDKEKAGFIAGLIESRAKVLNRDRRIFQDGIYIISKGVQDE